MGTTPQWIPIITRNVHPAPTTKPANNPLLSLKKLIKSPIPLPRVTPIGPITITANGTITNNATADKVNISILLGINFFKNFSTYEYTQIVNIAGITVPEYPIRTTGIPKKSTTSPVACISPEKLGSINAPTIATAINWFTLNVFAVLNARNNGKK